MCEARSSMPTLLEPSQTRASPTPNVHVAFVPGAQARTPQRGARAARRQGWFDHGLRWRHRRTAGLPPGDRMSALAMTPPPEARPGQRLSLRARLLVMVALSTAVVVGATTYLQRRIIVDSVEREALDAAGATALGVAAELTEREDLPSAAEVDEMLANFSRMVPALRALTLTRLAEDGTVSVVASTDAQPPPGVRTLSRAAIEARDRAVSDMLPGPERMVAVPLERDHRPYGAVVVSISMG